MEERIDTNPHIVNFIIKRNKNFPNSSLPVLIYQQALKLPSQKNKAAEIAEKIFAKNGWNNSWRNGIYDFHHYHNITHEGMAICMGTARVLLGGPGGKKIKLAQNDVIIIPGGVAHKCLKASEDFLCVGAYPQGKDYDINRGLAVELEKALNHLKELTIPQKDPLLGRQGF